MKTGLSSLRAGLSDVNPPSFPPLQAIKQVLETDLTDCSSNARPEFRAQTSQAIFKQMEKIQSWRNPLYQPQIHTSLLTLQRISTMTRSISSGSLTQIGRA